MAINVSFSNSRHLSVLLLAIKQFKQAGYKINSNELRDLKKLLIDSVFENRDLYLKSIKEPIDYIEELNVVAKGLVNYSCLVSIYGGIDIDEFQEIMDEIKIRFNQLYPYESYPNSDFNFDTLLENQIRLMKTKLFSEGMGKTDMNEFGQTVGLN